MKILQIIQRLDVGGLETLVVDLAIQLNCRGISVEVLCLNNADEKYAALLGQNKIPLHIIPRKNRMNLSFFIKAASLARTRKFTLLHAHSGCHTDAAILGALIGKKPLIYTAHGLPIFTRMIDRIEDSVATCFTDYMIAVSDEIEACLRKWIVCPRARFETIINGIDTKRFKPITDYSLKENLLRKYSLPTNAFLFGSVGRLEKIKNYEMLVRSAKIVFEKIPDRSYLVLVGDGTQQFNLQQLARQLGIDSRVIFLGMQQSIHEILPLFDCFTLSSLTEGTSISLLESQSCGIPAVVTNVGGNGFVVRHGENGYLCAVNDDEKMANYIISILKSKTNAKMMGNMARKMVDELFSIEIMTNKYIEIYAKKIPPWQSHVEAKAHNSE